MRLVGRVVSFELCQSRSFAKFSKSSQEWLKRQAKDPYVKKWKVDNYRCRSAYKLLQINDRHKILKPGQFVVDCGASPGSWTQVVVEKVNANGALSEVDPTATVGKVVSVDLAFLTPVVGAIILEESDFTNKAVQDKIMSIFNRAKLDVVLSDMSPMASCMKDLDHTRSLDLCMSALMFSCRSLKSEGVLLMKMLSGNETMNFVKLCKKYFKFAQVVKPPASRDDSAEIYVLCLHFLGDHRS